MMSSGWQTCKPSLRSSHHRFAAVPPFTRSRATTGLHVCQPEDKKRPTKKSASFRFGTGKCPGVYYL